jgi:hypothetical protein
MYAYAPQAFEILLGRVEDLVLDVPDILRLLSCFVARAMVRMWLIVFITCPNL